MPSTEIGKGKGGPKGVFSGPPANLASAIKFS